MKYMISALALAATLASGARAADLPSRKTTDYTPPPAFTWSGFYAGLNLGGGWLGSGGSNGGVLGGGQIGYNHQLTPLFLIGLESDFQGASIGGGNGDAFGFDPAGFGPAGFGPPGRSRGIDWFGTVRGRVGLTPLDHVLIYGTGGFAYGQTGGGVREGWSAGGGVEWAFYPNWSVKAEYLYTDLGHREGHGWGGPRGSGASFHTIRVGLNYHFNLFAPALTLAKY